VARASKGSTYLVPLYLRRAGLRTPSRNTECCEAPCLFSGTSLATTTTTTTETPIEAAQLLVDNRFPDAMLLLLLRERCPESIFGRATAPTGTDTAPSNTSRGRKHTEYIIPATHSTCCCYGAWRTTPRDSPFSNDCYRVAWVTEGRAGQHFPTIHLAATGTVRDPHRLDGIECDFLAEAFPESVSRQ
jgi:hypothetical protein